jgi:hypothetical protein
MTVSYGPAGSDQLEVHDVDGNAAAGGEARCLSMLQQANLGKQERFRARSGLLPRSREAFAERELPAPRVATSGKAAEG